MLTKNKLNPRLTLVQLFEFLIVGICANTRNHVLGVTTVYRGNIDSAVVRTGEVFREAVRRNAPAVIIFHAHPSSDPEPSPQDLSTMRQIVQAGKLLDVVTLDHIIIGGGRYVSLRERGVSFE